MLDLFVDPAALKMDHGYGMQHDQQYGSDQVDMSATHQSPHHSPQHAFSGGFDFTLPAPATFDPTYSHASYQTYSTTPSLHPLNTATTLWPSQLTNPSPAQSSSPPIALPIQPRPLAPVTQESPKEPTSAPSPPSAKATPVVSTSRRTLTDNDRRKMCRYHEANPTVKQTEIGAMFGVERSTVSKVLRNKEKYLASDDEPRSPPSATKKAKSKLPDIERTLSNWAKNRLAEGLAIDDALIQDEARKFAATLGTNECDQQINDPVWLEKFKQKNRLSGSKGKVKNSGSNRSATNSPTTIWNGSTNMAGKEENKSPTFEENNSWSHGHTQSTVSLASLISDNHYSSELRSPTSPAFFTPISSTGPSPTMPAPKVPRLPTLAPAKLHRRQTVPLVGEESPTSANSQHANHILPPPHVMDDKMDISPIGIDTSVAQSRPSTTIPTHSAHLSSASTTNPSPFSMNPPSASTLATNFSPSIGHTGSPPLSVSPSGPSHHEARAALETLRKFIEHQPSGSIDPQDYIVMGKWMEMLKLRGENMPGGMYPVPMVERADGTAPMGRKRSEHSLS